MSVVFNGNSPDADNIVSCVNTVTSSVRGSIPYMRDLGIDDGLIGTPNAEAEGLYIADVEEQISIWDDRANVEEIKVKIEGNQLIPEVILTDGEY